MNYFNFILLFNNLGIQDVFYSNSNTKLDLFEFSSNSFYHGIDWIYCNVSEVMAYDYNVIFLFSNSFFSDDLNFYIYFWLMNLLYSSYQLLNGVYLDLFTSFFNYQFQFLSNWYNHVFFSNYSLFIYINHPEYLFFSLNIINNFFLNSSVDMYYSYYNNYVYENFFQPSLFFINIIFIIFLSVIFISFYFNYFVSLANEESQIDNDFLIMSLTVESEKEISSFDDMILACVVLVYIFGWYFYIHCWSLLSNMPELVLVFYLFPCLYFIIIGIPTFLIYDFGIFFLAYLRGVGSSSILLFELMFDYIGVIIFYTRILVQGIRLVLMLFTYLSMHDLVLLFSFNQKMFLGYENINEFASFSLNYDSLSYFFLFSLPGQFLYWIYEILHTYFVVTVQFGAFFAIVFWLFLFLYTFFVIEKQENYFTEKRLQRKLQNKFVNF